MGQSDLTATQFKLAVPFNLNGAALHAALLLALHGVVGRVLVQFGEARKVKAGIDERLEGRVHLHRQETDVDQLNRLLANRNYSGPNGLRRDGVSGVGYFFANRAASMVLASSRSNSSGSNSSPIQSIRSACSGWVGLARMASISS